MDRRSGSFRESAGRSGGLDRVLEQHPWKSYGDPRVARRGAHIVMRTGWTRHLELSVVRWLRIRFRASTTKKVVLRTPDLYSRD